MVRIRKARNLVGRAAKSSPPDARTTERMARIRDFAIAHELAVTGRVEEARALLASYDTGAVVIEIVPGESGSGEVK
jgi:hypothetical protein